MNPYDTIADLQAQLRQSEAANVGLMAQLGQADARIQDLTWGTYLAEEALLLARYTITDAGLHALEAGDPPWA
jgi:hypothetical protein